MCSKETNAVRKESGTKKKKEKRDQLVSQGQIEIG
jgi:hypothetical protein